MKSRTLISLCQRPGRKPAHAGLPPELGLSVFCFGALSFGGFCFAACLFGAASFAAFVFGAAVFAARRAVTAMSNSSLGSRISLRGREPEQPPRVPRDHELLVRRDHPNGDAAAIGRDPRPVLRVRALVELDA